jgi:serralysin
VIGYSGDDYLFAGYGHNVMTGGTGDDVYVGTGDIVEQENQGYDTVYTWEYPDYTLPANVEKVVVHNDKMHVTGNELDNAFEISGGHGTYDGGAGNDTFHGFFSENLLRGGVGDDSYEVLSGNTILELAGEGIDKILTNSYQFTLPDNVEELHFTSASEHRGYGTAGNDVFYGNTDHDFLFGYDGNDTFNGMGGDDVLFGGKGDDLYRVAYNGDLVIEQAGEGIDTIETAIAFYTLGANVENLSLQGKFFVRGTGNELDNSMTAPNATYCHLYGGGGNDTLTGTGGSDKLYGDDGDDTLHPLGGVDQLFGGAGFDTVVIDRAFADCTVTAVGDTVHIVAGFKRSAAGDGVWH